MDRPPPLTFVRPGPNAFTWLTSVIRDLKGSDPFRPVTVLVPTDYSGRLVHWHLIGNGGYLNVFTRRLASLARTLAPGSGENSLWSVLERGAVRAALRQHPDAFGGMGHASLQAALLDLFREARRSEIDLSRVVLGDAASTERFSSAARDAALVYQTYLARIAAYDNHTAELNRAADRLEHARRIPPELARWGALILFLPARLDPAEVRLLAAAARFAPLVVGLIATDDPAKEGDLLGREMAERLAEALGVAQPEPEPPLAPVAELWVIRAPDPAEEVREVTRRIAADLEAGIPLHQMAILYRQNEPYAELVRDALEAAGLPWVSSEGRRLGETRPGRGVALLLGLSDRQFSRESVLEWLDTGPQPDVPEGLPPDAVWVRLSRAANVTRGAEQWASRFAALMERLAATLPDDDPVEDDGRNPETLASATRRSFEQARRIQQFMESLARDLLPPADGASWAAYVDWARALFERYVGAPERWPVSEREAAKRVVKALQSLVAADQIGGDAPSPSEFREALTVALEERRLSTGILGQGVLVEPVAAVTGLWFARVYILGMVEGALPPPPGVDPFFPEEGTDPLGRRARQRLKERRDFLVALATVDKPGGVLTLSAPDAADQRASFPSRWLLEAIRTYHGESIPGTRFATLGAGAYSWLLSVNSSHHAVRREVSPADLEDYRLQRVARWTANGRDLASHPLARVADFPLGRALQLIQARHSGDLTEYDGNLSVLSEASRLGALFRGSRPISASAVQTWAVCGFRYFLSYVLRIEPTEDAEDRWTIDARERGSLIHEVLEGFFRAVWAPEQARPNQAYSERDQSLLRDLAREAFAAVESRGVVGHALDWGVTRRQILADLQEYLERDTAWRQETGFSPRLFEQPFGVREGWPVLRVPVEGEVLAFRGIIDRIDRNEAGRVHVADYKTGSGLDYQGIKKDPVLAGQRLQLALYNRAARENLANATGVSSAFWFITTRGGFEQVAVESTDLVDERLASVLEVIARGIRAGHFPMVPGENAQIGFANCGYCDFDRICPTRRDLQARRKAGDPRATVHQELRLADAGDDDDAE